MNNLTENLIKKRAVLYCRVSSDRQVENYSLETQEKICVEYAERNEFEVVEKFIEEGESAKTADRTKLQELLKYCYNKPNNIQVVIFHKIDRFARDRFDYDTVCYGLRAKGITIHSATEPIAENPTGRLMEGVLASFAQFDNEIRTERCVLGMKAALREGRFVWMAPIGYENIQINGRGTIVKNEKAKLIRETFEEVAKNEEPIEIIFRSMIKNGLIQKNGRPLSRTQFYKLLRNPLYAGVVKGFGESYEASFEPIISKELFDKVQLILKYRSRKNYSAYQINNPEFTLRRFLIHPLGAKITGSWSQGRSKKYAYYRFSPYRIEIPKDKLEVKFAEYLNEYGLNESKIIKLKSRINYTFKKSTERSYSKQTKISQLIKEEESKLDHLFNDKNRGNISEFIFNKQILTIEKRLISLQNELPGKPSKDHHFSDLLNVIEKYLLSPGDIWLKSKPETKLRLQWFEFPNGVTFDGTKFRTAEIRSIYKLKSEFLTSKSGVVDPSNKISNGGAISEGNTSMGILKNDLIELKQILEDNLDMTAIW